MVGMGMSSTNWGASVGGSKPKAAPAGKAQENEQTTGKTVGTPGMGKK